MAESKQISRNAYLITVSETSDRCISSKSVLKSIGFNVVVCVALPDKNPLLSLKKTCEMIYNFILNSEDEWGYIFEDDVDKLENINLDEIVEYEKISNGFFYLGMCKYGNNTMTQTKYNINNHPVFQVSGCVRGAHAVAFSKLEMEKYINFSKNFKIEYVDIIYELYTINNPALIVRADLQSYIPGHLGIIYQDRNKFGSIIDGNILN